MFSLAGDQAIGCSNNHNLVLMIEPFFYQMSLLLYFHHMRVAATAVCFLLFVCCSSHLLLTLLALALSTAALLLLPRIKASAKAAEQPPEDEGGFADKKESPEAPAGVGDVDEQENLSRSTSKCSSSDVDEDACGSTGSSEESISDDENLIEISLPDGHFVAHEEAKALARPLPEAAMRQHGLLELLLEINEEDNLIEIDIIRGSIKCSRMGANC